MPRQICFRLAVILLIPTPTLLTSCEKRSSPTQSQAQQKQPEKTLPGSVTTETVSKGKTYTGKVSKCCWCVNAETNTNLISKYLGPKNCEQLVNDPKNSVSHCQMVKVEAKRCSFLSVDARSDGLEITVDLKIHGTENEYITALSPQPIHCNRQLTSTELPESTDPRCKVETCSCEADPNLPWNCELFILRKYGKKESLGQRTKHGLRRGCDTATCKNLFAQEVQAFCPTFE